MVILNAHILHKKYLDSKTMHWQFRIELVKHMLSNARQQPRGIVPVPDSPLCLVERHFIEPIPGQEGARRKHPSRSCFICNVSREALSDAGLGTVTNPKSSPLTGVQNVSVHCVLILVLGYITLKRTTQVKYWKLLERVWSLFKQMLNMSNEATNQSRIIWQLGHIVHVLKYPRVWFIMSSYCQWSSSVVSYSCWEL